MSEFGNPLNRSTGNRVVLSGVAKTTKPGWLARLSYVEPGSFGLVWIDDPECFRNLPSPRTVTSPSRGFPIHTAEPESRNPPIPRGLPHPELPLEIPHSPVPS